MSPKWGSTPRLTDWLTDRQSQCDFDFDLTDKSRSKQADQRWKVRSGEPSKQTSTEHVTLFWISNCLYLCCKYFKGGTVILFSASSSPFVVYPMRREHFHSNGIPHLWVSGINAKENAASRVFNLPAHPRRLSAHFASYSAADAQRLQDNISGSWSTRLVSTSREMLKYQYQNYKYIT
jgi:hypothetical protein